MLLRYVVLCFSCCVYVFNLFVLSSRFCCWKVLSSVFMAESIALCSNHHFFVIFILFMVILVNIHEK